VEYRILVKILWGDKMSGIPLEKLPHSCGSRQALQVFAHPETGVVDGFCFSCKKRVANPYGEERTVDDIKLPKPKTEAELQAEFAEIAGYPTLRC